MKATTLFILSAVIFSAQSALSSPARAEDETRPSTSAAAPGTMAHPCPFNCQDAGISKDHCKDWREGNTCYVQDTSAARGRLGSEMGETEDEGLRDREREIQRLRDEDERRRQENMRQRLEDQGTGYDYLR